MSDEKIFIDGIIAKRHPNAPDFVKVNLSFKLKEFFEFAKLHQNDGWINVQVKESKGGKLYAELDTFTPSKKEEYSQGADQARDAMADNGGFDDAPF